MLVRGVEADILPVCQRYGMGVIPWSPLAGGWLSGPVRLGAGPDQPPGRPDPGRYDLSVPENQKKLEAADALAQLAEDSGMSLIHLALAFVINHPAVTAAIIGPRTRAPRQPLGALDVHLTDDILDRIDEIVPPGTNFTWADAGYEPPGVAKAWARRRPRR